LTVHSVEDTIVGGTFSTSDAEDTDYEPEISAFTFTSDSDANTDEASSGNEVEDESPALGSVISSQASLLGQDYGDTSDSSSSSSVPFGQPRVTRLQRLGCIDPLEHSTGVPDTMDMSDYSSNDSSDTDSDTSDDDVMYKCEGEEPSIEDYGKQKHTKTKTIPTYEALVS
jgi:hypothetical protein